MVSWYQMPSQLEEGVTYDARSVQATAKIEVTIPISATCRVLNESVTSSMIAAGICHDAPATPVRCARQLPRRVTARVAIEQAATVSAKTGRWSAPSQP